MLGNLLGKIGISTLILEKELQPPIRATRAISIMPPAIETLQTLDLEQAFIREGIQVRRTVLHGSAGVIGVIDFGSLPSDFPFVLALPQSRTEALLEAHLKRWTSVALLRGHEVVGFDWPGRRVLVETIGRRRHRLAFECAWVCGCDGKNSFTRQASGIAFRGGRYRHTYRMAGFRDETDLGDDAHIYFTARGPVESFALPGRQRRWVVRTRAYAADPIPAFASVVRERIGLQLSDSCRIWESPFTAEHYLASNFAQDHVWLCGDAAHVISPIGGQGMNAGFGDAEECALALEVLQNHDAARREIQQAYGRDRRRAVKASAGRDAMLMRVEAIGGSLPSAVRNAGTGLFLKAFRRTLPTWYSMLDL